MTVTKASRSVFYVLYGLLCLVTVGWCFVAVKFLWWFATAN